MDKAGSNFLLSEEYKPYVWLRYVNDIFSFEQKVQKNLETFLKQLDAFHLALIFRQDIAKFSVNSLDVQVSLNNNEFKSQRYNHEFESNQLIVINF